MEKLEVRDKIHTGVLPLTSTKGGGGIAGGRRGKTKTDVVVVGEEWNQDNLNILTRSLESGRGAVLADDDFWDLESC